jgi:hypothetical protein
MGIPKNGWPVFERTEFESRSARWLSWVFLTALRGKYLHICHDRFLNTFSEVKKLNHSKWSRKSFKMISAPKTNQNSNRDMYETIIYFLILKTMSRHYECRYLWSSHWLENDSWFENEGGWAFKKIPVKNLRTLYMFTNQIQCWHKYLFCHKQIFMTQLSKKIKFFITVCGILTEFEPVNEPALSTLHGLCLLSKLHVN